MTQKPEVTIAIVSYNRARYLARAIRSALNQVTHGMSIEVLCVDDGSTDTTVQLLQQFEGRVRVIRLDSNVGVGAASQRALEACQSDLFVRLDSDDYLSSLFLQHTVSLLQQNLDLDIISSNISIMNDDEIPIGHIDRSSNDQCLEYGAGILFRTEALRSIGGYPLTRVREDYELLRRLLISGATRFHLPLSLYRRRLHSSNLSSTPEYIHWFGEL